MAQVRKFLVTVPGSLADEHAVAYWCRKNSKMCNLDNFRVASYVKFEEDGKIKRIANLTSNFMRG